MPTAKYDKASDSPTCFHWLLYLQDSWLLLHVLYTAGVTQMFQCARSDSLGSSALSALM